MKKAELKETSPSFTFTPHSNSKSSVPDSKP